MTFRCSMLDYPVDEIVLSATQFALQSYKDGEEDTSSSSLPSFSVSPLIHSFQTLVSGYGHPPSTDSREANAGRC